MCEAVCCIHNSNFRSLGERGDMDITIDGFHSWMWKGLGFLLPFLYMGYFFELYNAYTLYHLSYRYVEQKILLTDASTALSQAFIFFIFLVCKRYVFVLVLQGSLLLL